MIRGVSRYPEWIIPSLFSESGDGKTDHSRGEIEYLDNRSADAPTVAARRVDSADVVRGDTALAVSRAGERNQAGGAPRGGGWFDHVADGVDGGIGGLHVWRDEDATGGRGNVEASGCGESSAGTDAEGDNYQTRRVGGVGGSVDSGRGDGGGGRGEMQRDAIAPKFSVDGFCPLSVSTSLSHPRVERGEREGGGGKRTNHIAIIRRQHLSRPLQQRHLQPSQF